MKDEREERRCGGKKSEKEGERKEEGKEEGRKGKRNVPSVPGCALRTVHLNSHFPFLDPQFSHLKNGIFGLNYLPRPHSS